MNSIGRISCIIPTYNSERFLPEALESVLAQTYAIDEVIVVDDGSTDGTRALMESIVANGAGRIHYLWQENRGPSGARNTGLQAAAGQLITFLDADDLWHPEKTARQIERFQARPELGISVTQLQNVWMDEVAEELEQLRNHPRAQPLAGYVLPTAMVRQRVFEQVGLLNSGLRYSDSAEWFMRAKRARIADELISDVLVSRRLHLNNDSRHAGNESRAEFLRVLHAMHKPQRADSSQEITNSNRG